MPLLRLLLLFLALSPSFAAQGAKIVVSIEPLAMLMEPLLGPSDSVHVLLKANTSPHHYSLKASDLRALQSADLILWVGPNLEQFLQKPLASLSVAVQLDQLAGLTWPEETHSQDDDHAHGSRDPHLWLNPDNALVVMQAARLYLAELEPEHASILDFRFEQASQRLKGLTQTLEQQLTAMQTTPYIAYHSAYGHWNQRFGLHQIAAVSLTPEQKPGARHIYELQGQAKDAGCLVAESFYNNGSSQQLAKALGLKLVLLDPLGTHVIEREYRYESLMRNLAAGMLGCVAPRI